MIFFNNRKFFFCRFREEKDKIVFGDGLVMDYRRVEVVYSSFSKVIIIRFK